MTDSVSSLLETYAYSSSSTTSSTSSSDTDYFMEVLLAELTNQNPLEPMDNFEMISQFSQLTTLSEIKEMNSSMTQLLEDSQLNYAAGLMGKTVTVMETDGTTSKGVASAFGIDSDEIYIEVNNLCYSLDEVVLVQAEETTNE